LEPIQLDNIQEFLASPELVSPDNPEGLGPIAELTGNSFFQQALERDLQIIQLSGNHRFGDRGPRLKWSFTDSSAREFRDLRFAQFGTLNFDSPELISFVNDQVIGDLTNEGTGVVALIEANVLAANNSGVNVNVADSSDASVVIASAQSIIENLTPEQLPGFDFDAVVGFFQQALIDQTDLLNQLDTTRDPETLFTTRSVSTQTGLGLIFNAGFQVVDEDVRDSRIELTLPTYFFEDDENAGFELTLGGAQSRSERETGGLSAELFLEMVLDSGARLNSATVSDLQALGLAFDQTAFPSQDLFAEALLEAITGGLTDSANLEDASIGTGNRAGRVSSNSITSIDLESYFVQGHLFWDDYFLKVGARFESEFRGGERLDPQPEDPFFEFSDFDEDVVLPSVSFGGTFLDGRISLLAAWSRTVARPTFFEFSPNLSFDFAQNEFRIGNPDLENSEITNFDISGAVNFGEEQSALRLSLFQKNIESPIVSQRLPTDESITFINGEEGQIAGVEIELDFKELKPFSLVANATFIDASLSFNSAVADLGVVETEFPFQPNFIANLNLGYENLENDWSVNLIYNYTGAFNTLLPAFSTDATRRQSSLFNFDLVARKTFSFGDFADLKISAGVQNLIANDQVILFEGGSDETVIGNQVSSQSRPRTYFLGASLEF